MIPFASEAVVQKGKAMIARWRWMLVQLTKKLWLRATLFSLLGVATALISILLKDSIPFSLSAPYRCRCR